MTPRVPEPADTHGLPNRCASCGSMFKDHHCAMADWHRDAWLRDHERLVGTLALELLARRLLEEGTA